MGGAAASISRSQATMAGDMAWSLGGDRNREGVAFLSSSPVSHIHHAMRQYLDDSTSLIAANSCGLHETTVDPPAKQVDSESRADNSTVLVQGMLEPLVQNATASLCCLDPASCIITIQG